MIPFNKNVVIISIILLSWGCGRSQDSKERFAERNHFQGYQTKIEFAKRFNVKYYDGYKLVTISNPYTGADIQIQYALVQKGASKPTLNDSIIVLEIPLDRIVVTSTSHLPAFEYLNQLDHLIGFPNTDLICSEMIRKRVENGDIKELGNAGGMNMEALIASDPDMVMDYVMGNEYDKYNVIKKMGIPVVINADYVEESPLGRAEWIKFLGLLSNQEKRADSIFNSIKHNYDSLKSLVAPLEVDAKVYSGIVYGDIWYMPGGNNFGAKFLEDANATYLWGENPSSGFIQLSFESVYDKAHDADFWIGLSGVKSLNEIKNMDIRYTDFKAYKTGNVYNYNGKVGAKGGIAFLELGYLRPDIILADLIKILHPQVLPDYQLYFYQQLQ